MCHSVRCYYASPASQIGCGRNWTGSRKCEHVTLSTQQWLGIVYTPCLPLDCSFVNKLLTLLCSKQWKSRLYRRSCPPSCWAGNKRPGTIWKEPDYRPAGNRFKQCVRIDLACMGKVQGIRPIRKWMLVCWWGDLTGAGCKWFARFRVQLPPSPYPSSLFSIHRIVWQSGIGLPGLFWSMFCDLEWSHIPHVCVLAGWFNPEFFT